MTTPFEPGFYVFYARVNNIKGEGVRIVGIHYGGFTTKRAEADELVKKYVNTIKCLTILHRVVLVNGPGQLLACLRQARAHFEQVEEQMVEAQDILEGRASEEDE